MALLLIVARVVTKTKLIGLSRVWSVASVLASVKISVSVQLSV